MIIRKYFCIIFIFSIVNIHSQSNKLSLSKKEQIKLYLKNIINGENIQNNPIKTVAKPKISVIIPLYEDNINIKSMIQSIQNQKLSGIDIICVIDNTDTTTIKALNELKKDNPNLTVHKNKNRRGLLYSLIFGALKSKGEYVAFLNHNGLLSNNEILERAYIRATEGRKHPIDIIQYRKCESKSYDDDDIKLLPTYNTNNINKVIKQPDIKNLYLEKKAKDGKNEFIYDKIYSRRVIQKAADIVGPQIWNQKIFINDDTLLSYSTIKSAKTFAIIDEIGYWQQIEDEKKINCWDIEGNRLKNPDESNKKIGDYILLLERLFDITNDDKESIQLRENELRKLDDDKKIQGLARSIYYDRYLTLCEKLIKWKFVTQEVKNRTLDYIKHLFEFKVGPEKIYEYILKEDKFHIDESNLNLDLDEDNINDL